MDQNRCLLDVINNPELLESFLESESTAEANNQQPKQQSDSNKNATSNSSTSPPDPASSKETKTIAPPSTVSTNTVVTPPSAPPATPTTTAPTTAPLTTAAKTTTATKRAPKRNTTPRAPAKSKNSKTSATPPVSTTQSTNSQPIVMQPRYTTQQVLFQSPPGAIRQPAILNQSPLGQTAISGVPQQQRLIRIETTNGPMYFAISPGPISNQSINQQNQQQPGVVIPSSQPMMMPRMPGQILLSRPLSSPGQLLPGQQQFIQIQQPMGPMLLALPTQQSGPLQSAPVMNYNNFIKPQQMDANKSNTTTPTTPSATTAQAAAATDAKAGASKSGLDLADLLLDCGILPENRNAVNQPPAGTIKTSQPPSLTPTIASISPSIGTSLPSTVTQPPIPTYAGQPMPQQPIRITFGPNGQMIMQPTVYGAIRPVLTSTMGQAHINSVNPSTNIVPSNSPVIALTSSPSNPGLSPASPAETSKKAKGKNSETKRSRSEKTQNNSDSVKAEPSISQSGNVETNLLPRANNAGTVESLTETIVLQPTQIQSSQAQPILNQLDADQKAALNPSVKQSFRSLEDACKRLLRYHVFDTETVGEDQLLKVDEIFEAGAESLITRKKAIYDKFKLILLKQSMKIVPSTEEVMMEQELVDDERAFLKKDKELFREYEAHLETMALKQVGDIDSKKDDIASAAHSRDVDDWRDKWSESYYSTVPDSEAAKAIESILNEKLDDN